MSQKRLTNAIRAEIAKKVADSVFGKKIEDLTNESNAVGMKIYEKCVGKYIDALNDLPDSFVHRSNKFVVVIYKYISLSESPILCDNHDSNDSEQKIIKTIAVGKYIKMPACCSFYKPISFIDKDDEDITKHNELLDKINELKKERSDLEKKTRNVLFQFSSTKRLIDGWPEIEKFLPSGLTKNDDAKSLPSVSIKTINDFIKGVEKV